MDGHLTLNILYVLNKDAMICTPTHPQCNTKPLNNKNKLTDYRGKSKVSHSPTINKSIINEQ